MKHLKTYESLSDKPEIGDYVICEDEEIISNNTFRPFIKNNIGQIIEIDEKPPEYNIKYENIPTHLLNDYFYDDARYFYRKEIKYFSDNKEDLEILMNANKYNL